MLIELSACNADPALSQQQVNWGDLLKAVQYHGITGLVYDKLLKRNDPDYPPPHFQAAVIQAHRSNALQMIDKCEQVKAVLTSLIELRIKVVVLKGPAVAQVYYPQAPLRYFTDLNLFALSRDKNALDGVLNALGFRLEAGYVEPMPKLIPSVITHHHTRYEHRETKFPVEIHWEELLHDDLVPRDLDGMWRRAVSVNIEGLQTKTLSLEDHLLHLCAHAYHHRFDRLFRLTDLLFIVRDHSDEINWELFVNLVSLEEAQTPVYQSFSLINKLFGVALPDWVLAKLKPDGFRRWWHQHFFTPKVTRPFDMQEEIPFSFKSTPWFQSTFLNLMIMGRRPEKLQYLLRLLLPTPEWLRQRFNLPPERSLWPYYILRLMLPPKLMERLMRNK
ncbi:MAG: nucleotidyltransferase family protein [Anaerolineaceae bacterium]|nr:nucleotidyltransferase family protein [Anaerolineaceae bacterium]